MPNSTSYDGPTTLLQGWVTVPQPNGMYSFLYNGNTGAALDIGVVSSQTGLGIRTASYDAASLKQQFLLQDVGDGRFRIFAGDNSGRCLEAYTAAGSTTMRLVPYVDLGSATEGQKWNLHPIYPDFISGQVYNLQPGNGHNLTVTGTLALASQNDGTAPAQQWTVNQPMGGYYTFTSGSNAQLLTVTSGTLTTAAANAASTLATANNQYFKLVPSTRAGYYKMANVVKAANGDTYYLKAVTGGYAVTTSTTPDASTDWQFIDTTIPTVSATIVDASSGTYAEPTSPVTTGNASAGWTFTKNIATVAVTGVVIVGSAIGLAAAGATLSAISVPLAIGTVGATFLNFALSAQLPSRRALLATGNGALEQTYRLGKLTTGKYLIFDASGDHVLSRDATDGSIAAADYTGAANQQWTIAPAAALTATLYAANTVGYAGGLPYYYTASHSFAIGDYVLPLTDVGNDAVTSLSMPTGLEVTLYKDNSFVGTCWSFRKGTNGIGAAVREASSVRVRAVQETLADGGVYKIVSRSGGGAQVLQPATAASGSQVSIANYTGSMSQHWSVSAQGTTGAGIPSWKFTPQNNTVNLLAVQNDNRVANQPIQVATGGTSQQFQIVPTTDGYFHITTDNALNDQATVLCLQTTANDGVQLKANTGTGNPEQEWRFERLNPAATVYEMANYTGGYALPLASGRYTSAQLSALGISANSISALKVSPDYEIIFFANDNFTGQSWRYQDNVINLASVGGDNDVESIIVQPRTDGLVDGQTYTITNASTGTLLQAAGMASRSPVSVGSTTQDQVMPNQLWKAGKVGTKWTFSPQNAPLNNLTDNSSRASQPYTLFSDINQINQTNSQQYQLTPTDNGNFQIYTAPGSYSLEARITGNVLLADPTPTNLAQQWRFEVAAPVTLYVGANYVGAIPLKTGFYSQADLRNLGIPLASSGALQPGSVRVTDGYEIVLFQGDAVTSPQLGDYFTDQPDVYTTCVSLLVRVAPVVANVYSSNDYKGTDAPLSEGSYISAELLTRGLDANDISSLKVPDGYEVVLFDHADFSGPVWNFNIDHSALTLDAHGHHAADLAESIIVRKVRKPINGATYWIQPVQNQKLALGSSTGVTNGPITATTFNYKQKAQKWVVEMDALGLWSLRQPGANYLDAPDRNIGTALTYGSPGFFPQAFHLVNVEDNIWRIMGRDGLVCATLNANNSIGFATPLALDEPTQSWYFSLASTSSTVAQVVARTEVPAVTLYPNPATATITLQDLPAGATVTVLDLMGKTVLTSTKAVISIAGLPSGVYIAVVGRQHVRFIKQ